MNNIDINNNFINQLKEKYKIIIGIVLFIFLLVIIIQVYFFYNNKKILDTSIVYNQIKTDLENNESTDLLNEISKEKNFYGVLAKIDIINLKTAALFSAATKTGACISGSSDKEKKALESYGRNLGLAFQIADDSLDYYAKEKFFGKEIGKDFYEGKVTLPLITIFQKGNEEEKKFLTEIMKKERRTEEDFSETLALIFKYKAVETSLKKAEYFVNVSYDALAIFPDSEDKRILQSLTSFSLNRSY